MSGDAGTRAGVRPDEILIRACRPADSAAIERLGHPPAVAGLLSPALPRRVVWGLAGTRAVSIVAVGGRTGSVLGSVQFLRSRRSNDTWMFGHWRVAAGQRRRGIGRRLLGEGMRALPGAIRLYSYVDSDNQVSIAAHQRLGFEAGRTLLGSATLGELSTFGAATPVVKLTGVRGRDWNILFTIYARAVGSLWLRLFPGLGPRNFLGGPMASLRTIAIALARGKTVTGRRASEARTSAPIAGGTAAGFVVWDGAGPTFYADPEACDPGLLARVAIQMVAQGSPRDLEIQLRGLPRGLADRRGPIVLQELMGMPDVQTQWHG